MPISPYFLIVPKTGQTLYFDQEGYQRCTGRPMRWPKSRENSMLPAEIQDDHGRFVSIPRFLTNTTDKFLNARVKSLPLNDLRSCNLEVVPTGTKRQDPAFAESKTHQVKPRAKKPQQNNQGEITGKTPVAPEGIEDVVRSSFSAWQEQEQQRESWTAALPEWANTPMWPREWFPPPAAAPIVHETLEAPPSRFIYLESIQELINLDNVAGASLKAKDAVTLQLLTPAFDGSSKGIRTVTFTYTEDGKQTVETLKERLRRMDTDYVHRKEESHMQERLQGALRDAETYRQLAEDAERERDDAREKASRLGVELAQLQEKMQKLQELMKP